MLRCLGAGRRTLVSAYLVQTAGLGVVGAGVGVACGVAAQLSLPGLLAPVLPFDLTATVRPEGVVLGLILGTWVAVVFSLLPLLGVHRISPLAALRPPGSEENGRVGALAVVVGALVWLSVFGLAWVQLGGAEPAAIVTAGLTGVFVVLAAVALALARAARTLVPRAAPFPVRQGLSGLFRPGNQTPAVVTALGLGAFLIGALLVVEDGLRAELRVQLDDDQPSLVLFDIQSDQTTGVRGILQSEGLPDDLVPIVPARLSEVAGESVSDLLTQRRQGPSWMYRRLYRNTYRGELGPAERLLSGSWWGEGREDPRVTQALGSGGVRVSLERELAEDLGVGLGDVIEWDVQGVPIRSVVSSVREVEWASFQPNFYAVFELGSIDDAPATFVSLVRADDPAVRERIQRAVLTDFPNVSFLDVALVREALQRIASQVTLVLRSMAGFVLGGGGLVLLASLLTTRFKRRRESALLKTLGASGAVIRRVLLWEYVAIGTIGGAAGVGLAALGGNALLGWQFDLTGTPPWTTLLALWGGIVVLTVAVGWSVSGPVLRATPVSVLAEERS